MRVVLDTNVLLAAFAAHGLCEALLAVCLQSHEVILSEHILTELNDHLKGKLKMSPDQRREIDTLLREGATIVEPAEIPSKACPDPDDLPVLGTAVTGRADALVTGDAQLLRVKAFQGVPILSPRAFYDRLR